MDRWMERRYGKEIWKGDMERRYGKEILIWVFKRVEVNGMDGGE